MLTAILWGGLGSTSLLIGYALARRGLSNHVLGIIMGIGAGALLSAIAYELVPESVLTGAGMGVAFVLGAPAFALLLVYEVVKFFLRWRGNKHTPQQAPADFVANA